MSSAPTPHHPRRMKMGSEKHQEQLLSPQGSTVMLNPCSLHSGKEKAFLGSSTESEISYFKSNPHCNPVTEKRQLVLSVLCQLRNQLLFMKAKLGKAQVPAACPPFSFKILPEGCRQLDSGQHYSSTHCTSPVFPQVPLLFLTSGIYIENTFAFVLAARRE